MSEKELKKDDKDGKAGKNTKGLKRHKESLGTVPSCYLGDSKSLKNFLLSVDKISRATPRREATRTLRELADRICQALLKENLETATIQIQGEDKNKTLTKVHLLLKEYPVKVHESISAAVFEDKHEKSRKRTKQCWQQVKLSN